MSLLQPLGQGQGYLKAGSLGFNKSGKTYTSALLAVAVKRLMNDKRPIAMYDTEGGSEYISPLIERLTGQQILGIKSRDFEDLMGMAGEAEKACSVLIVDSVTHIWRSLCDSYLAGINRSKADYYRTKGWQNFKPKTSLEFQDWAKVKGVWARWTDFYLNAELHIAICGRAGFEYDMEQNQETGKKELVKTGTKMKTETEFGFEPSLLFEMERDEEPGQDGRRRMLRTATVIGDRFNVVDGMVGRFYSNPQDPEMELAEVAKFFGPHLDRLKPRSHTRIRTDASPMEVDEQGDAEWSAERRRRAILCEEIKGVFESAIPGQSVEAKKQRADVSFEVLGTRSWTAVETMHSDRLRECLTALKKRLGVDQAPEAAPPAGGEDDDLPFDLPPSPPPAAKAKPAEPTPKSVPEDDGMLDDETLRALELAIGDQAPESLSYLRAIGKISSKQGFQHLPSKYAQRIIAQPKAFLRNVVAHQQAAAA